MNCHTFPVNENLQILAISMFFSWEPALETATFEPRHENKNCSVCLKDQCFQGGGVAPQVTHIKICHHCFYEIDHYIFNT